MPRRGGFELLLGSPSRRDNHDEPVLKDADQTCRTLYPPTVTPWTNELRSCARACMLALLEFDFDGAIIYSSHRVTVGGHLLPLRLPQSSAPPTSARTCGIFTGSIKFCFTWKFYWGYSGMSSMTRISETRAAKNPRDKAQCMAMQLIQIAPMLQPIHL